MKDKKIKSGGLSIEIKLEPNLNAELAGSILSLRGPKGEIKKEFLNKNIAMTIKEGAVTLKASKLNKMNKKFIKSYAAHIKNMVEGASKGHRYTLKICSGHFPMNVSVSNGQLIVKNFLGEKVPRTLKLKPGAEVKVEGDTIFVESPSKEIAGQVSADIEKLTIRTGYDGRVFQDGIWISSKNGEEYKQ
ncbi:50S ribosomal protein L6 [Candidatus Woesearchaeota archaeon]|nr:50S ribosomal protein L6 [Candidatus Woesearchaeota archaeon]